MSEGKILILGATGMLGHVMWQRLSQVFPDTFATIRHERREYRRFGIFEHGNIISGVDALEKDVVRGVLKGLRPAFVINCIGVTKRYITDANVTECICLNTELPHRLAQWCKPLGTRVLTFSTDCVFDGTRGNYKDTDSTNATDIYGKTKALGELRYENTLTIRSSFIGRELQNGTELLEWFLSQDGKQVSGFRKAMYSGITTLEMSRVVVDIIRNHSHLYGLYNVSGQKISKYDLLEKIRNHFDVDIDVVADDSVVCDRSLDSSEFRKITGYEPPEWDAALKELAEVAATYNALKV